MALSIKKIIRKTVSGSALRTIEGGYRTIRAQYANARYGWPARGMQVIMITGTNGKTTTAHYLFSILRTAGYNVGLSSTAEFRMNERVEPNDTNMTVVDPIKLRRQLADFKTHQADFVILEATSQALDQHRLNGIPCKIAIMTNLTQDHLDYHKTMEAYAAAKAKLWKLTPEFSILNADDSWYPYFKERATGTIVTYGQKRADVRYDSYTALPGGARFALKAARQKATVMTHLAGLYNAANATAAAAAALQLGVSMKDVQMGIASLEGIPGRLQEVLSSKPYRILVDYAHTPDGLEKLLLAARQMVPGKVWLVFGACGDRDKGKRPTMGRIAAQHADAIVVTDEEAYSEDPRTIRSALIEGIKSIKAARLKFVEIGDRKKAIKHALDSARKGDIILITGLGHEQYRIEGGKRIKWNDATVVKKLLKKAT